MGRQVRLMQPAVIANSQMKELVHHYVLLELLGFLE